MIILTLLIVAFTIIGALDCPNNDWEADRDLYAKCVAKRDTYKIECAPTEVSAKYGAITPTFLTPRVASAPELPRRTFLTTQKLKVKNPR